MPTREKTEPRRPHIKNDLPVLHVDAVYSRRREDGVNYLSFATNTPDYLVEQVRLMITDESLQRIIDDLCATVDYFPRKPRSVSE